MNEPDSVLREALRWLKYSEDHLDDDFAGEQVQDVSVLTETRVFLTASNLMLSQSTVFPSETFFTYFINAYSGHIIE